MRERLDWFSESLPLGDHSVSDPHRPRPQRGSGGHLREVDVRRTALQAEDTGTWTWGVETTWELRGWGLGGGVRGARLLGSADIRAPWEVLTRPTPTLEQPCAGPEGSFGGRMGRLGQALCGLQVSPTRQPVWGWAWAVFTWRLC